MARERVACSGVVAVCVKPTHTPTRVPCATLACDPHALKTVAAWMQFGVASAPSLLQLGKSLGMSTEEAMRMQQGAGSDEDEEAVERRQAEHLRETERRVRVFAARQRRAMSSSVKYRSQATPEFGRDRAQRAADAKVRAWHLRARARGHV